MILLNGHSLEPKRKVPAEALGLTINERESTADFTPADMTGIDVNSWFLDDTEPGKGMVYRVRSIRTDYKTSTPRLQLEHIISTLKDTILFGEVTPKTIAGGSATTCTAEQAVRYILARSDDWVLGSFSYGSVRNAYKFDGDTLFDALETVTETLEDACWTYDLTKYPFRLNITKMSDTVMSEMRAGRNLVTISRTVDRSSMYTRFYPIGKDDLHLPEQYVQKNVTVYGVISKVETDTSLETAAELRAWANERLRKHSEPTVTDDVEGLELAEATGESLDRFQICRMCRVPLPDWGTTITERIIQLNYPDKVHNPEKVKVTMGNARNDVVRIIADNMKKGGKGGRGAARQAKEDHAWFEDTNDHVSMCAIGIIGTDANGEPNWLRLSNFTADGTGLHASVQSVQNDVVKAQTQIEVNEYAIQAEVEKRKSETASLSSTIRQQADKISLVVQEKNGKNVVNAAKIVASVNSAGSSVVISANHVDLRGYVTMSQMQAAFADAQQIKVQQLTVSSYFQVGSFVASWQDETVVTGISYSNSQARSFLYGTTSSPSGTYSGHIVSSYTTKHLYYLGR